MVVGEKRNLSSLPPEILSHIISFQGSASDLCRIGLVDKTFHRIVEDERWRVFVRENFPSFEVPPLWKQAAHALTTLQRNFDRRAVIVRPVEPLVPVLSLPEAKRLPRWRKPMGQTMGFRPVIDSRLELYGNTWQSQRETLAYAAGAELILRTTDYQHHNRQARHNQRQRKPAADHTWISYREPGAVGGRDDITALHILPQEIASLGGLARHGGPKLVVGRANGDLNIVQLSKSRNECIQRRFYTGSCPVQYGDVSLDPASPLLSVCLSNNHAALYSLSANEALVPPLSTKKCVDGSGSTRLWSTKFLSQDKLAVGRGVTDSPLHVYTILPTGFSGNPRVFKMEGKGLKKSSTTYAIIPIPESYGEEKSFGNVFAAGYYNGDIKLHDLRSPRDYEVVIADPSETSPIFSLLMKGRERLIAGAGQHNLIKVYDLRMPEGKKYSYLDAAQSLSSSKPEFSDHRPGRYQDSYSRVYQSGWNFFAGGRNPTLTKRFGGTVYSLSSPSSYSPQVYAGLENTIMEVNFSSIYDRHPDPLFNSSIQRLPRGDLHVKNTWLRDYNDPVNLSMYEQRAQGSFALLAQRDVAPKAQNARTLQGYDERWAET